jgi:DEAD/DEAH box helicase domain-containing protein
MTVTAPAPEAQSLFERLLDPTARPEAVVHVERLPAVAARHGWLARPLAPAVGARVPSGGLWSHQVAAIDLIRQRTSVALATGTASGKSLCYQLPIAEAVHQSSATSMLLFPTKALAHDQLRALTELDLPGVVPGAYDGDADGDERKWIRANANTLLTNPEMLHHGVLPRHARWAGFLSRLQYVVVDELHELRGVFGTHVSHLLRRLRRVCAHYGSDPTFVFCSATIGDPARLASDLCGLPVTAVTDDGSPKGTRWFVLWNPHASPDSTSGNRDAAALLAELVRRGHRTISFCRSRKGTEVVAAAARRELPAALRDAVRPYRGGYLPTERREIEEELFSGQLLGVVATTALELGIDIGDLDACVLNGFPGTVASLWQQAGRAGRGVDDSYVVLVAGDDQLDQWFMHHPGELFSRPPEPAVINPHNPYILLPHLACAAYERPLTRDDAAYWPDELDEGVRRLVQGDQLKLRPRQRDGERQPVGVWAGQGYPAHQVGLRTGSSSEFRIALADGTLIGTVDESRAFTQVHPGAIYLHRGQAYRVSELDLDDQAAIVEPHEGDEYTQPQTETAIWVLGADRSRPVGPLTLFLGDVEVKTEVVGYKRRDVATGEVISSEALHLPPTQLITRSFWYVVPEGVLSDAGVVSRGVPGTLHAVEHAAIALLPLFTICDRWDVGGVSTALQGDTGQPSIFIYDGYPGGAGIAELGFQAADRHLHATREVIAQCECEHGCPSCVQSPKCGNGNEPLDKDGALRLLGLLPS